MRRAPSIALLAALACGGCVTELEPTQIVLVVDTDLGVPGALDRVEVVVSGPGSEETRSRELIDASALPLTLGIVPAVEPPPESVTVRVRGTLDDAVVVERTARVAFVEGEVRRLDMHLLAGCSPVDCGPGLTCSALGCRTSEVSPDELPPFEGPPERWTPSGETYLDFALDVSQALCETRSACHEDWTHFRGARCEDLILQILLGLADTRAQTQALLDGTASFRADRAALCIQETTQLASCPALSILAGFFGLASSAACRDVAVGTVPLGEPCRTSVECAGDAFCPGDACPVCQARRARGERCERAEQCSAVAGSPIVSCAVSGGEGTCEGARVEGGATVGQPCDYPVDRGGELVIARCADGLDCDWGAAGVPTLDPRCAAPPAVGEPCACGVADLCRCGRDARCIRELSNTCVEYRSVQVVGEPCDETAAIGRPFRECAAVFGLGCVGGRCQCVDGDCRVVGAPRGGRCASALPCEAGLACRSDGGSPARLTCDVRLGDGEPCEADEQCETGRCAVRAGAASATCVSSCD